MLRYVMLRIALVATFSTAIGVGLAPCSAIAEPDHIERLIQDAKSTSGSKRLQAVEALGQSGDLRALQPLLDLLHDVEPTVRDHALKALKTLTQSLRQIYTHLAQWIDALLLRLDIYLAPDPPVKQTQHRQVI